MQCSEHWIDVASFDSIYRVSLDLNDRPNRFEGRPIAGAVPQDFIRSQLQNLGSSGGERAYLNPVRATLASNGRGGAFVLEITARLLRPSDRCQLVITSRIVERLANGHEHRSHTVFQGLGSRECCH